MAGKAIGRGQCGYNCSDYSRAIFEPAEPRLNSPAGGKPRPLVDATRREWLFFIDPEEFAASRAAPRRSKDPARLRLTDPVQRVS